MTGIEQTPPPSIGTRLDFSGRRVLVAGGSRGIGRAIADGFARGGASVSICARGEDTLATARAELQAFGHPVHAKVCDLSDVAAIQAWVDEAAATLGGVDILVNNASAFGQGDTEAGWEASFGVDVMAIVRASRSALPYLEQGIDPCIVNISSISGLHPSIRTPAYGAAKAAVNHYTSSQAAALARKGIRVNAVAPGSIEFPGGLWEKRRETDPKLYERTLRSIPFGRMGTGDEIANLVLFLASPHARWITGQAIVADGGQMLGA